MSSSDCQKRYWSQLQEFRIHLIYLHLYAANSEWWDKCVNIFLAITSTSSIAAWAVWQKYQMVWAIIIAASQVVAAIKSFLPYQQRLKAIGNLNDRLQEICLESEKFWYSVAQGEMSDKEIHDLYIELRSKSIEAEKKFLKNIVLPKKAELIEKAEAEADIYFRSKYFFEEKNDG